MGLVARALFVLAGPALRWISDHPLRTAAGVGALLAAGVVLSSLGVTVGPAGVELPPATADRFVAFARYHPAYPAAVAVGLGMLLFWR
ncbi:MAG: hypothetical protein V5A62_13740 [Haloarculaceae archaeon]